jgi:hypothetical protein
VKKAPEVFYDLGSKTLSLSFRPIKGETRSSDPFSTYREIIWVLENVQRLETVLAESGKKEIQRVKDLWTRQTTRVTKQTSLEVVLRALEGEDADS